MASNSVYNMLFISPKGNSLDKLTVKKIYFNKKKSRKNLHLHHKTLGKNPKTFFYGFGKSIHTKCIYANDTNHL